MFRERPMKDGHEGTLSVAVANQQIGNRGRLVSSVRMRAEWIVNEQRLRTRDNCGVNLAFPAVLSGVNGGESVVFW